MATRLGPLVDDMVRTMHDRDYAGFRRTSSHLWAEAQGRAPNDLTAAVEQITPILGGLTGIFSKVAVLTGALVEFGASPLCLREVLPKRAAFTMGLYELFPTAWSQATGGAPLPERATPPPMNQVVQALVENAKRRGISENGAKNITLSWYDVEDWINPMITVMAHREFRTAMAYRDEVRDAAAAIAKDVASAEWLHGLSLVLDDEPLVVLDPASGRGFRLTIGGVGDNYQLHTLLADRVTKAAGSGLLGSPPPEPAWVAAATDAVSGPFPHAAPILRRFRLFDGHGTYIYPEGSPSDIEPFDGKRVVVLHPPLGNFGWENGRTYQHMTPTVTVEQVLDLAEAAHWLTRISPARETDLMAANRGHNQAT